MKTIIVKKNRNYYFKRIIMILFLVFMLFILERFLTYPSEHIYFLLPTRNSVIMFSATGIIFCCLTIFLLIKMISVKDGYLKIDEEGIFNGFLLYKNKYIKWEEINSIEIVKYNYNKYIAIYLKEVVNNESGISSFIFNMYEKYSFGTPYTINPGDLDCTFKELEKCIFDSWEQYNSKSR